MLFDSEFFQISKSEPGLGTDPAGSSRRGHSGVGWGWEDHEEQVPARAGAHRRTHSSTPDPARTSMRGGRERRRQWGARSPDDSLQQAALHLSSVLEDVAVEGVEEEHLHAAGTRRAGAGDWTAGGAEDAGWAVGSGGSTQIDGRRARLCAGVVRWDATRWIDSEEAGSARGGGGGSAATGGGDGGGSATARSGRRPRPVATIAARAG
jgi:hypothetical protein